MNYVRVFVSVIFLLGVIWIPTAFAEEAAPVDEVVESLPALENLDFASGEVTAYDAGSGKMDIKVYLDAAGNANEQLLTLAVGNDTEITDGENDLKADALVKGAEVDVEYDTRNNKATYIFVY